MKELPEQFDAGALVGLLADGWGFRAGVVDYAALGAGSYHWVVADDEGRRAFVTVDDLDQKPWLGDTRDSASDGLRRAFDTARALRDQGLAFVVAPIPTVQGETLRRIGARHTVALFPFVDGQAGHFGHSDPAERAAIVSMLADLHQATPAVASVPASVGLELPGRRGLEAALDDLNRTWSSGPFAEPVRHVLARHASDVAELLGLADRLAADIATRGAEWVVTHGEPHAGNVIRTAEGHLLVDWDTVGLAPPERDLWMVVGDTEAEAAAYAEATGREVDVDAVDFFRLTWDLKDIASYLEVLRAPHRETEDTAKAYRVISECVATRDQWAGFLG